MKNKIEKILRENTLCVLCTQADKSPYCSLMTYLLMEDISTIYLVSKVNSRKYQNLLANPRVSVLIDTRQNLSIAKKIISITFEGLFQPLNDWETQKIKSKLASNHSELNKILENPDAAIFSIKLSSFLLLDGPVDSYVGNL